MAQDVAEEYASSRSALCIKHKGELESSDLNGWLCLKLPNDRVIPMRVFANLLNGESWRER